jgi:hypothetical protein
MERDPYDTSIDWTQSPYSDRSQQTDFSRSSSERQEATAGQRTYAYPAHTQTTPQASASASPRITPAKQVKKKPNMPKQRALALVSSLKKGIIVSCVVSFGFLGLLSANHLVSTTSTVSSPTSSSSSSTTKPSGSSSTTSSSSSTTQSSGSSSTTNSSSGSSLNQQSGGYGFGSGSSSQGSASGTSVS